MRSFLHLSLLFALLGFGSLATAQTIPDEQSRSNRVITAPVPSDLSIAKASEAVLRTALGRKWQIETRTDGYVEFYLVHRHHDARMFAYIDDQSVRIYCESYRLLNGRRWKKQDPKGWIENLQRDLVVNLQREAYLGN